MDKDRYILFGMNEQEFANHNHVLTWFFQDSPDMLAEVMCKMVVEGQCNSFEIFRHSDLKKLVWGTVDENTWSITQDDLNFTEIKEFDNVVNHIINTLKD